MKFISLPYIVEYIIYNISYSFNFNTFSAFLLHYNYPCSSERPKTTVIINLCNYDLNPAQKITMRNGDTNYTKIKQCKLNEISPH